MATTTQVIGRDFLLQEEPQILSLKELQPPTLTIEEQPARFYRYRYESDIRMDSGRVGGLLLGRSSTDGNKSFVRVRVSGIDPAVHSQLQLTVCTVSAEEKAPHPYYLHGDHCSSGYFQLKKSVDALRDSGGEWEITFDRLAVICVPKLRKMEIEKSLEDRRRSFPQLRDYPTATSTQYTSKSLDRISLAFSLSFSDVFGREWHLSTVFSDEIVGENLKKRIEIDCLNPAEVLMGDGSMLAIHTATPTTGICRSNIKVHFAVTNRATGSQTEFVADVEVVKKHLLLVRTPDVRSSGFKDRMKCEVTVQSDGFKSESLCIVFLPESRTSLKSLRR
ncbi:hypothetical protein BOX15_Mlig012767g1 [Macrostomum lignano]|uniref:RHD domain-containing protein n=1 Tax=Macrostomum lignano TaxID=282301 RepID=A0A267GAM8_9PLAT|nr:hypothetical protein BOX15_Mlig012767g1 [Macrostomum lignano]